MSREELEVREVRRGVSGRGGCGRWGGGRIGKHGEEGTNLRVWFSVVRVVFPKLRK